MTTWYSLFFRSDDQPAVASLLRAHLDTLGYTPFNPFGLMPGRTYPDAVRLFVAPSRAGWTRIIAEQAPPLPLFPQILEAALTDSAAPAITVYCDGMPTDPAAALAAWADRACIERALRAGGDSSQQVGGIPLDLLPADVQQMAAGVDARQMGKLFDRLSASMQGKLGGDPAAGDLLKAADWNSAHGQQIQRLMACLKIDGWRAPDFVSLRGAYALHERRRRNPNATLYPGDAETMAAVADALSYIPVYAGKASTTA